MISKTAAIALFTVFLAWPSSLQTGDDPLIGFTAEGSVVQRELEKQFDSFLSAGNLRTWMRHITSQPHHVGSPFSKDKAEYIAEIFRKAGFEVEIDEYQVLFPTPAERVVELLEPEPYKALLTEPELPGDASSANRKDVLPPYNAYSADGDVTGELVYVNQGIPRDYEELDRLGIDVAGKIVIARYGGSWRGIKPKVAYEHGAIGCILYSDPRDDGYFRGDVYPEGAFKMERGAQRGSVADMPQYPGDPLTPGVGAKGEVERYTVEESPTIMKIPVLPLSYQDAAPLLRALEGPVAPPSWRGALPFTYHIGPGPATVRVKLRFNWELRPAYNVVATMEGAEFPDEWIMRGNHHDAWVFGATDPTSGMVALMEEARAIGELTKTGWRPRRTIKYAGWDAEEPGLLGSTEFAEYHAEELREKLAVYINTDSNGRGFLGMGGSHSLEAFINQVAADVDDPQTDVSVLERARARRLVNGDEEAGKRKHLRISPLGSGSDYTPFLQHLGIASLNLGFGGENAGGSYHSMYDSFEHYTRFGDPTFEYGIALAKVTGRAVLRLANADILPYTFTGFADNVNRYLDEVTELHASMREETNKHNELVARRAHVLANDPKLTFVPPEKKDPVPFINFAPLQNAVDLLGDVSEEYDKRLHEVMESGELVAGTDLNKILLRAERALTDEAGLPRRPWFRHHIYAPGFYTGYGVKTLPAVREAIEERDWNEANDEVERVAKTINGFSDVVRAAALEFQQR